MATWFPSATARGMLAGFRALGLDDQKLRAAAGIDEETLAGMDSMLPQETFFFLWEAAQKAAPQEELPTQLGLAIPFGAFGALDYLAGSSATVEAAFLTLQAHFRQVAAFGLEVSRTQDGGLVRLAVPTPFPGQHLSDEMTLAVFVARFRQQSLAKSFVPTCVRLTRPAPAHSTLHERLLGAPVVFGCAEAALEIPLASWTTRMPNADPSLLATLRHLAGRLELGGGGSDLELALRARLRTLLPDGVSDAGTLARLLGMSLRTLNRRLLEQGRTYREVLDAFRQAEAERLLTTGNLPLADVALQLGFSDQTAWNRAFRRWKGTSPREWLAAQGSSPAGAPRA
jgi:AraC-like DNA-binding protein